MGGGSNVVSSLSNRFYEKSCGKKTSRSNYERLLDRCGCGSRPVLKWSGTYANLWRPFFGYPNYNISMMKKLVKIGNLEYEVRVLKLTFYLLVVVVSVLSKNVILIYGTKRRERRERHTTVNSGED
ncbi:hypothetical protein Ahy_B08g091855 [Arachis hypogaea]|uniref:Uncharacterized protein n=1 Tax=Arachis hypogaea TaxID=3818 RepID=A0A444Y2P0_ARAHY|nr:hypothetical protein Ahy_B08g091855 [Arachis hypogaea]